MIRVPFPAELSGSSDAGIPAAESTVKKRTRWLGDVRDSIKLGSNPRWLRQRLEQTAHEMEQALRWGGTSHLRERIAELETKLAEAEARLAALEQVKETAP